MIKNIYENNKNLNLLSTFLESKNIWHNITKNKKAWSCKDAINKRNRLWNIWIPLSNELKSNIGSFIDKKWNKIYILLHCRWNNFIDYEKVNKILGFTFERMWEKELKKLNLFYGWISPFISIKNWKILQFFDKTIFEKYLPPYTMMTNAGDLELWLEFNPQEVISFLKNTNISDIIKDSICNLKIHKIGILTWNSPESWIMLWETMNKIIRSKLNGKFMWDISFPVVQISSIPEMGLSMELELREKEVRLLVLNEIENLCKNGATIVAIACNTTQYFSEEIKIICKKYDAKYIWISDCVEIFLEKNKIKEFDFLWIKYVVDFDKWSAFKKLKKNYKINVPSDKNLKQINDLAFEVKKKNISSRGINKLRDLINNSIKSKYVLVALTEISILLVNQKKNKKSDIVYIDTLYILANSLADHFLEDSMDIY